MNILQIFSSFMYYNAWPKVPSLKSRGMPILQSNLLQQGGKSPFATFIHLLAFQKMASEFQIKLNKYECLKS